MAREHLVDRWGSEGSLPMRDRRPYADSGDRPPPEGATKMHGRPVHMPESTSTASDPNRWRILGVLVLALLVTSVDHTIINVALPSVVRDLEPSAAQLQWIVAAYTVVFAGLLLTAGSLGD